MIQEIRWKVMEETLVKEFDEEETQQLREIVRTDILKYLHGACMPHQKVGFHEGVWGVSRTPSGGIAGSHFNFICDTFHTLH